MKLNSTKAMLINKAKYGITPHIGLDIKWFWVYNTILNS